MLLLLKNHKVKRKNDWKVTKNDLKESQYIMVDTSVVPSELSKHYVLIDPSKIPWFTEAVIRYQLLYIYDDHDEGLRNYEPIPPVETTIKTVSELINIINCIDRLYIVNQMISNDEMYWSTSAFIIIGYFEVILYNEKKKVYHKIYQNADDLEKRYGRGEKFPLKALKKFKDIYNTDIVRDLLIMHEFLYIHKDMTWSISTVNSSYSLIGIPLLGSRTMTLLSDREYLKIVNIRRMSISYTIIFIYDEKHRKRIQSFIDNKMYDDLVEMNHDYVIVSNLEYGDKFGVPFQFIYLDIFSNIDFSIRLTNLVYDYVEGFMDDLVTDGDGVDTIASITIYDMFKKDKRGQMKQKSFFMNELSSIPLDNLLKLL